ncbi:MAG: hypothetical protein M0Q15_17595 [Nevskia sp.]|jgi:hypothetical protein|nr:hypothetical protein [Nevskia sp.]
MKTFLAFVICIATCGYAAYRGLQWLAMAALFGALCVLYKQWLSRAFATALDLLKNTTEAKLGALEIRTEKRITELAIRLDRTPVWVNAVLSQLSSEEVGLLLSVTRQRTYTPSAATKKHLRSLRDRGLIEHDKSTLEDSSVVWSTSLGQELTNALLGRLTEPGSGTRSPGDTQAP